MQTGLRRSQDLLAFLLKCAATASIAKSPAVHRGLAVAWPLLLASWHGLFATDCSDPALRCSHCPCGGCLQFVIFGMKQAFLLSARDSSVSVFALGHLCSFILRGQSTEPPWGVTLSIYNFTQFHLIAPYPAWHSETESHSRSFFCKAFVLFPSYFVFKSI